jgi:hypothetical protein
MSVKHVVDKLLMKAWLHSDGRGKYGKPGELIEKLSTEEREIIKTAKANDFNHEMVFKK